MKRSIVEVIESNRRKRIERRKEKVVNGVRRVVYQKFMERARKRA